MNLAEFKNLAEEAQRDAETSDEATMAQLIFSSELTYERILAMIECLQAADAMRDSCVLDIPAYDAARKRLEEM